MSSDDNLTGQPSDSHSVAERLIRPGDITYLHIPAADVRQAACFYRDVFGWTINAADSDRPSFDDATGHLSGAWMSDQEPSRHPGLLPYIYVEHVQQSAQHAVACGGEIVSDPRPEGNLTIATIRDPAGNVIGLWHDNTR